MYIVICGTNDILHNGLLSRDTINQDTKLCFSINAKKCHVRRESVSDVQMMKVVFALNCSSSGYERL